MRSDNATEPYLHLELGGGVAALDDLDGGVAAVVGHLGQGDTFIIHFH